MPLTIDSLHHMENAGVVPLGVAENFSINDKGERYNKRHVTHDCSFPGPPGLSMNNQVLKDTLQPCFYVFFLLRIIHMIAAMLIKWPSKCILIGKTDLDAAYRQVHANTQIAAKCIKTVGKLAFLCFSLTFRTTPAPEKYTTISEASIELGNYLLADRSWDSKNLQSPHQHILPR